MNNKQWLALILLTLAIPYFFDTKSDEQMELDNYCASVELYKETDGEKGWPDYNKSYDQYCK